MISKGQRGDRLECLWSIRLHADGIPFIIWPQVLRDYGVGQLDIIRYIRGKIEVIEVKSSGVIAPKQLKRLKNSCQLLAILLDKNVELKLVSTNICQRDSPFLSY